jgi:hypothetical protein
MSGSAFASTLRAVADAIEQAHAIPTAPPDELLPIARWGIPRQAALALVATGKLPAARVGGRWYAKRSCVLRVVDLLAAEQAAKEAAKPRAGATVDEHYAALAGAPARGLRAIRSP